MIVTKYGATMVPKFANKNNYMQKRQNNCFDTKFDYPPKRFFFFGHNFSLAIKSLLFPVPPIETKIIQF